MPQFFLLDLEIVNISLVGRRLNGLSFDDLHPVFFEPADFLRIIRQQTHLRDAQVAENLGTNAIIPEVFLKSKMEVGFNRVHALILEGVGPNFIGQSDPPAFLLEIDHHPAAFLGNALHSVRELFAAVTPLRPEHITGQTLRMDPDRNRLPGRNPAFDQGNMFVVIDFGAVDDG